MIAFLRLHVRNRSLRQVKHCMNVDVEGHPPFLVAYLTNFIERGLMSGIVHKNVHSPEIMGRPS